MGRKNSSQNSRQSSLPKIKKNHRLASAEAQGERFSRIFQIGLLPLASELEFPEVSQHVLADQILSQGKIKLMCWVAMMHTIVNKNDQTYFALFRAEIELADTKVGLFMLAGEY